MKKQGPEHREKWTPVEKEEASNVGHSFRQEQVLTGKENISAPKMGREAHCH